jgi:UDP-N-acetyl-D-mannosaminuronate dehydrogenase
MQAAVAADAVVIITNHLVYYYQAIIDHSAFVFDTRNATREVSTGLERVVRL